jgi:hypothetical protein
MSICEEQLDGQYHAVLPRPKKGMYIPANEALLSWWFKSPFSKSYDETLRKNKKAMIAWEGTRAWIKDGEARGENRRVLAHDGFGGYTDATRWTQSKFFSNGTKNKKSRLGGIFKGTICRGGMKDTLLSNANTQSKRCNNPLKSLDDDGSSYSR